jgi:hypothetical protein
MLGWLAAFAVAPSAWSAEFCIASGDVVALADALNAAEDNGEDNFIELEPGIYHLDAGTPSLYYYSTTAQNLTIEGGFTPYFGGGCGKLLRYPANATMIDGTDGDHIDPAMSLRGGAGGHIQLKFLKVQNFLNSNPQHAVAIYIGKSGIGGVYVDLENTIFEGNVSTAAHPIFISSTQSIIRNSVFAKSQTALSYYQLYVKADLSGSCVAVFNSTFAWSSGGRPALGIDVADVCTPLIANTLFWGNSGGDLHIGAFGQFPPLLSNDDIGTLDLPPGTPIDGIFSLDPLFVDASGGNYALSDFSLLRDEGSDLGFFGGPGVEDVSGLARTYGAHPDIGAYEIQDVIFASGNDQSLP